jgi:hypothetical protein
VLLRGDTTKKARVFGLGGDDRTTTEESTPLEIEICDLGVELDDTEMTSWSGCGGVLFF